MIDFVEIMLSLWLAEGTIFCGGCDIVAVP